MLAVSRVVIRLVLKFTAYESLYDSQLTELGYIERYFFYGIGLGLFQSPNNSTVMGAVPRDRLGIASGLLSLSRTTGGSVGVPLFGAVFGMLVSHLAPKIDVAVAPAEAIIEGLQGTFHLAALILCAATIASVFKLPQEKQGSNKLPRR